MTDDNGKEYCAFCDFELDEFNTATPSQFDYHKCCKDHANHASYPQIWLLRKEHKQPYKEPSQEERICAVCSRPLTEKEFSEIKPNHVNFTCTLHRRASQDFNIDITREKYGLKEAHTQRTLNDIIKVWNL